MKLFFFMAATFLFFACSNSEKGKTDAPVVSADSVQTGSITYPYTAGYSSDYEIGKPAHAQMVLNIWKDWENNTFDQHREYYQDTVSFYFADGSSFVGSRDSMLAIVKRERAKYTSMKDEVHAWIPAHSRDRNDYWVLVWGKETFVKQGVADSISLQETWLIKDDKVSLMYQFAAKPEPTK